MALTDTLTGIANAIRTKDGTEAAIPFLDMPQRILDIPSGGGGDEVPMKDVNFYDYDGTRLYSYTIAEAQALTALPDGPTHELIVFDEWNWTLEDIKNAGMPIDVGACYTTKSGATELDITLNVISGLSIKLYVYVVKGARMTIDWGDGVITPYDPQSGATFQTYDYTYSDYGDYTIKIYCDTPQGFRLAGSTSNLFQKSPCYILNDVRTGENLYLLEAYTFNNCVNLKTISMAKSLRITGTNVFYNCISLKGYVMPYYPGYSVNMQSGQFQLCSNLKVLCTINSNAFGTSANCITDCKSLSRFVIPTNSTTIAINSFANATSVLQYVMHKQTPPTLSGTNAFTGINGSANIIVPSGTLSAYQNATNWKTYLNYMKEVEL